MSQKKAIIVFGRLPVFSIPAKTSLGKELKNQDLATNIGHTLTGKTLQQFADFPVEKFFCFADEGQKLQKEQKELEQQFSSYTFFPQPKGKDVRGMKEAFEFVFSKNFSHVILLGTDIACLTTERIEELFETLLYFDVVLQPMKDRGYGVIGMKAPYDLFSEIQNFGSRTEGYDLLKETEELCTQKRLSLFVHPEKLSDIDTKEDLKKCKEEFQNL